MFDILSIQLENFRSYKGKHEFTFPTKPGLYSLTGINKLNPRLGANDTGKTTLLEAIYWCFYGITTRGLRAGDIVSWGRTTAKVTVEARVGRETICLGRGQNPNSLHLNGAIIQQTALEQKLRLGPDQFIYAVMLPQFGNSFFDLGPSEKLNLFSQIMGLDYWLGRSEEAKIMAEGIVAERTIQEREVLRLEAKIEAAKEDITSLQQQHANFKETRRNLVTVAQAQLKKIRANIDRLKTEQEQNNRALGQLEKKLGANDKVCPTCKQPVFSNEGRTLQRNQSDFKNDRNRVERQLSVVCSEYTAQERRIDEARKAESPYEQLARAKLLEVGDLERKARGFRTEINGLSTDHAAVDFWVGGFKRVRLYVVETALRQLEIEVNNNLTSLGLTDWKVTFDIERETKAGGLSKGFTTFITPTAQHNRVLPVRWESFSGGSTQRLRLAGNLGLANLIMERAGLRNQIEFYDEPTAHLSTPGVEDLLGTLRERANVENRRIWIVDHRSLDYAFDGQLVVIKDENGSHLDFKS